MNRSAIMLGQRLFDIVLSLFALSFLSPSMVVIGLAVKLSSSGPILFKYRHYGLNGQEILLYKFRSMKVMRDGNEIQQAAKHDTRITPVGAFLRRTSLDELPQLINVLQGRISLVGHRPHEVAHNKMYRKLIGHLHFPEEIIAELYAQKRRRQQEKWPRWRINLEFAIDILLLLWSVHIQIRLQNFQLNPGKKRNID
jgi:Bacterial sugar transferase